MFGLPWPAGRGHGWSVERDGEGLCGAAAEDDGRVIIPENRIDLIRRHHRDFGAWAEAAPGPPCSW